MRIGPPSEHGVPIRGFSSWIQPICTSLCILISTVDARHYKRPKPQALDIPFPSSAIRGAEAYSGTVTTCSDKSSFSQAQCRGHCFFQSERGVFENEISIDVDEVSMRTILTKYGCESGRCLSIRGGGSSSSGGSFFGSFIFAGYHPFGYKITNLGQDFLATEGALESDIGRFLASLKTGKRKKRQQLKESWLEIVRVAKTGQALRIYRTMDELMDLCLRMRLID